MKYEYVNVMTDHGSQQTTRPTGHRVTGGGPGQPPPTHTSQVPDMHQPGTEHEHLTKITPM